MSIKSALRDWLSMSYGMKSILRIGSLRSPPPFRLRRTSPYAGGRTTRAYCRATYEKITSRSFIVPPLAGGRWWRQPSKGDCISSPAGRLYGFIQTGAFYNLEASTTILAPKGETTHYDLCVALLLQIMFAVHARGASNLSPLRTFGPAGRQPSSPSGLVHKASH